uniref:Dynamin-related protein 4C-like n=1 Tax=Tanacetum cinerariifolium TaxID=118510 RepID=A0A6L2NSJ9_TANCI|nr:dynamin-related protein 4C-like [Tanacetum cinerariifolium]
MEYIKPQESIILNVLSATIDFSTCESICMSRRVDSSGQRTLAVVTKCDRSPDGLLEKVTADDVNIGLGYICVRNRINNETYDEARIQETKLFESRPLLSKIDKSMVGIPVLAHRLVEIQSLIISKCLPDIVKKVSEKLNASVLELNKLPKNLTSIPDAMAAFMHMVGSFKETLDKMLIRGDFDEYVEDKQMHCNARVVEMLDELSNELHNDVKFSENFLVEEMHILEESNGIRLPNFLPHSMLLCLLQRKVNNISGLPISFANKVWGYLEMVCVRILMDHGGNHPQLLSSIRKATQKVMEKMKLKYLERVVEMTDMEKITDYTCDPDFFASYNKLMRSRDEFVDAMNSYRDTMTIEGHGTINVEHLFYVGVNVRDQAFDLKMRMTAYWPIVLKRMVDCLALQLRFLIQKVVKTELEIEIVNEVLVHGGGIEKMLNEAPSVFRNDICIDGTKSRKCGSSSGYSQDNIEIIDVDDYWIKPSRDKFVDAMKSYRDTMTIEGHGTINVKHLFYVGVNVRDQAFDLKMRMTAYWPIVLKRMVDCLALQLRFLIQKVVKTELEIEIVNEVFRNDICIDGTKLRSCGSSSGYSQDNIEIIDVDDYWIKPRI